MKEREGFQFKGKGESPKESNDKERRVTNSEIEREIAAGLVRMEGSQRCGGGRRILRKKLGGI